MNVVHPASIATIALWQLAVPLLPLLAPLFSRVVQGSLRYAALRREA